MFPFRVMKVTEALVEGAFDASVEDIFDSFEREPVASGSIGQVHIATLRPRRHKRGAAAAAAAVGSVALGRKVAVKVQHPALVERLEVDLALLNSVGALLGPRVEQTVRRRRRRRRHRARAFKCHTRHSKPMKRAMAMVTMTTMSMMNYE